MATKKKQTKKIASKKRKTKRASSEKKVTLKNVPVADAEATYQVFYGRLPEPQAFTDETCPDDCKVCAPWYRRLWLKVKGWIRK